MIELRPDQREAGRGLFLPDRPGPQTGLHVIQTGLGQLHVDRWPEPRVAAAIAGEDLQLAGDAASIDARDLRSLRFEHGTVDAPEPFVTHLESAFPGLWRWPRLIARLDGGKAVTPAGIEIRRLGRDDARAVGGLHEDIDWISQTWGGPEGMAGSGLAFGAFAGKRLVSVAVAFTLGERYDDIGVVTEEPFRRRGINAACVARVVDDVARRGRRACWSTSPDNTGSLAVAARFGARKHRDDVLYMVGFKEAP
jgi:RimJ/RimL family protein N-acetyltransferase